uniref:Group I intronic ORF n=1 Tax=Volvocales sp. NrCl902 TaxID=2682054 RepID=A0A7G1GGB6_9CHLO|nr:group I intronic ORF [Volvocales sp. NrCl902]
MPVCGALLKYGVTSFALYILEVVPVANVANLPYREDYWHRLLKPSYNVAPILDQFVGQNHPHLGKPKSQEVCDKISATLTGRKLSDDHIESIRKGARKKAVFCYDFGTKQLVTIFDGIRPMSREVGQTYEAVRRKVDSHKPFSCIYNGISCTWILSSFPLD